MPLLAQDLRYAMRQLRKSPGFFVISIVTLALGIGANTAIFTVVNAALLRSLPYREPARLVYLDETRTSGTFTKMEFSYPDFQDFRAHNQSFSDVGGYSSTDAIYSSKDGSEQLNTIVISANFFDVLGVRPLLGRVFQSDADLAGGEKTVLLSYGGWQKRFGGDPNVVGRTVTLNGQAYSIAGVLPRNFQFAPSRSSDFWMPLSVSGWRLRRNAHWLFGIGRLKPGVTLQQAQAEASGLARQLEIQYPDSNPGVGFALAPLHEALLGDVRPVLLVLMAAVAAVLLIACSNLAGLQLARSMARQKDIAVRTALGASWARIVRLLLTESLLIAAMGGIAGVALAYAMLPILVSSLPKDQQALLPFLQNLQIGQGVLWFSAVVSIFAGVAFGLLPALQGARADVRDSLQDGNRTTPGSLRHRLRNGLVVSQIAIAIVLLVCAGLLMKSLSKLLKVDPGFNVAHLLTFDTSVPPGKYHAYPPVIALERELRARLQALPGVKSAATVSTLPIRNGGGSSRFVIAGHAKTPEEEHEANGRDVSPNYFETMGIPLRAGRLLSDHDDAQSPHVVVINQALADEMFPHEDPLGKRIDFAYTKTANVWEIVGVVGNENLGQLDHKPTPVYYDAFPQSPNGQMGVVLRTAGDPSTVEGSVTAAMRELDPLMPVTSLATMDTIIAESPSVSMRRYPAYLIGAFAALALVLAVLGIYGLLAYVVAQRTRELGIRLALGAQRSSLLTLVISSGVKLALIGVAVGAVGSLAAGRMLSALLFAVHATDITILLSVALMLVLVSVLASYVPARRAAAIEPMKALRTE